MTADALRDLARVKALFQLRTIAAVIGAPAKAIEAATAGETGTGSTEGESAVPQEFAMNINTLSEQDL